MSDAHAQVLDMIFGRWRSQILYAGVQLGIFDALRGAQSCFANRGATAHQSRALLSAAQSPRLAGPSAGGQQPRVFSH
jgi:hypothetical protein